MKLKFFETARRRPPDSGAGAVESCPEGAATDQPRATPWETSTRALKGRHKGNPGQVGVARSGLGVRWSPGPRGIAPGWLVVAPSGQILVVVSEESQNSTNNV